MKKIYYTACFHEEEADRLRRTYEKKYENLKSEMDTTNNDNILTLLEISKKVIANLESPKDILLSSSEEGMRFWIRK